MKALFAIVPMMFVLSSCASADPSKDPSPQNGLPTPEATVGTQSEPGPDVCGKCEEACCSGNTCSAGWNCVSGTCESSACGAHGQRCCGGIQGCTPEVCNPGVNCNPFNGVCY